MDVIKFLDIINIFPDKPKNNKKIMFEYKRTFFPS